MQRVQVQSLLSLSGSGTTRYACSVKAMRRLFGFDARPQTRIWRDGGRLGHRRKDLLKYDVDASYPTPKRWCMIRFPVSKPPKGLRPASGQAADTLGSPDHAAAVVTTSTTLLQSVDAVRPAAGRVKCCGSGWGTLLKCPLLCKRSRSSMHCSHCYLSSHPWVQPVVRLVSLSRARVIRGDADTSLEQMCSLPRQIAFPRDGCCWSS